MELKKLSRPCVFVQKTDKDKVLSGIGRGEMAAETTDPDLLRREKRDTE